MTVAIELTGRLSLSLFENFVASEKKTREKNRISSSFAKERIEKPFDVVLLSVCHTRFGIT